MVLNPIKHTANVVIVVIQINVQAPPGCTSNSVGTPPPRMTLILLVVAPVVINATTDVVGGILQTSVAGLEPVNCGAHYVTTDDDVLHRRP